MHQNGLIAHITKKKKYWGGGQGELKVSLLKVITSQH